MEAFNNINHARIFSKKRVLSNSSMMIWLELISENLTPFSMHEECNILDYGCGTGRFSIPIAQKLSEFGTVKNNIFAYDPSRQMLQVLNESILNNKIDNICILSSSKLDDLPKSSIHLIFMSEVLHLIDNKAEIVQKLLSLLVPGGVLIIRSPYHKQLSLHEWYSFFDGAYEIDCKRHLDGGEIKCLLESVGYGLVRNCEIDESIRIRAIDYANDLKDKIYSTLHLLPENIQKSGLDNFLKKFESSEKIQRTMLMTATIATKIGS